MSEDKNVSKPRQLWDSAVKAVKGGSTEQLVETFTSEMTLVAEGLCEDQNNLRKELAQVREMAEKLEHRADNEQEVLDTTLRENQKDIDRRLDELTRRIAALEVKTTRRDKDEPRQRDMGIICRRVDYRHGAEPVQVSYRRRL